MDETLLSIGELAATSGLSPKALRLYDESGLLVPRRVDPFTGYRSYGADQVGRARLIASLRGLGMGLARIGVLCDLDGDAAAAELRSWWRQEEADALSRAAAVTALAHDLGDLPQENLMTTSTTTPRTASALHQGLVRSAQQDAVLVRELPGGRTLLAVADGFGTTDDLAAGILTAFVDALEGAVPLESAWAAAEALVPDGGASGSTLTAALLEGDRLEVAHIGDSRVLLVHGDRIEPVTQDHTHVRSLLAAGRLSPDEAAAHPDRAVLNRALAADAPTAPDLLVRRLEPGDLVLVATDGLHAVVDPSALAEAITGGEDVEALAESLIDLALAAGGLDNVALALARS
ncbi:serine/threonine protein phosphatase [Brachybacterium ginsengisoli]|uniref:Serine/threonine protein phosphatase n=1 Tax=Brachybacterium ginsengisoli TaxID=1331682 RepID=A0A291GZR7_9MICO|nr:MerR family transcriptional regulator [Brachybacterium ginsengisoli]ATG55728.1 serine/threonine protein phosphatase [Brachybacterium ginsengisoli]